LKAPLIRRPAGEAQLTPEKVTGDGRAHRADRGGCPASIRRVMGLFQPRLHLRKAFTSDIELVD
jgi:hypothetical protein